MDAHILVFPFPAQGHMIALLDLTHQIITTSSSSVRVTILVTPKNLHLLNQLLSVHPKSIEALVLPFPSHPCIPAGFENAKDMPSEQSFRSMIPALGGLHGPLKQWFQSHPSPPVAIVSDMFLGWTHHLAAELGIPRVVFSPSGALAFSAIHSLWRRLPSKNADDMVSFRDIPNSPDYPWEQISPLYRSYVEGNSDSDSEFLKQVFLGNLASWGLVVNTCAEMERIYLEHLKKEMPLVWAVGPVAPMASSASADGHVSWLDACGDSTVVYVCFGSQAVLRDDQTEALASGLERSGVPFVWSVRHGKVPAGFEDRVAKRGLVIRGWAPQVAILGHRAIGAFLTHCGWNSVLESVVAGVLMLAWPMTADQFVNATLLVEQLKAAIRVCEGAGTVPDSDDLGRVLAESVASDRPERERARKLSREALAAIGERGSSTEDLKSFIRNLREIRIGCKSPAIS